MSSLYKYQKSLANEGDNTESLHQLRPALKNHWNNIRDHLQGCHAFATDVFIVEGLLGPKEAGELRDILGDMEKSAEEQRERWQNLKNVKNIITLGNGDNHSSTPAIAMPKEVADIHDIDLKAWVEHNFAAAFPDKGSSAAEFKEALTKISTDIDDISKFWENTQNYCQKIQGLKGDQIMSKGDAKKFTQEWLKYQKATEEAIVSITKTNVAILVEPTAVQKPAGFFRRWLGR